jgi:hypothetical protein
MAAQGGKTFRIFVSSTFSDMKEERNVLQKHVFPKLRELCMQHGCRFQAIDLRWGVSEEAAIDQQTMKICLDEIARCQKITPRPNFIVLLGDRYGWRPLPAEIPAKEFEEMQRRIKDAGDKELLMDWYKRDDNAVPPVYCLQPRTGEFIDFAKWESVERRLRIILLQAIAQMTLTADEQMKYTASATEQEIVHGALRIPDADEHVFAFFRTIKNLPKDLSAKDFVDLDESGSPDNKAHARLNELKERLRSSLPGNIYDYEAEWTGSSVTIDHISKLCDDVLKCLWSVIETEIAKIEEQDSLEGEIAAHDTFGVERTTFEDGTNFFVGRTDILQTIGGYVKGGNSYPLAVVGESGSGKTAVMAQAAEQVRNDHPNAEIIVRFIGATPDSSDGRALLESLCRQISRQYGASESTIPMAYRELVEEFPKRLELATAEKPLIIFLDAFDQLSDVEHTRNFIWLPADLPEHVRLIVSTLPGQCLSALERKLPPLNLIKLEPMPPEEGCTLLDLWLKDAGRTLQDHQREEILSKFAGCRLPLYLKLAFEEARRWKSYNEKTELSPDIPGVIRDLLARLSSDKNHGAMLVSRGLGYLAAAKNGLSEDELLDVLSLDEDEEVFHDFMKRAHHEPPEQRLPVVIWSRLYFDLEPYLTEHSVEDASLLTFYHRQLGEVVAEEYLTTDAQRERHRVLADYFEKRGYDYPRTLDELAYHFYQFALVSGDCQRLYKLVEDETFKRRQFQHFGRPEPIITDINYALDLAARHRDAIQLIHFSMMRINLTGALYKTFLYRFVEMARQTPELAREVVELVTDPMLRRMGLVLLAWLFNKDEGQREFARELIEDALRIHVPAAVAQTPVLLEMIKELYCSGIDDATGLLKSIPNSPVRQTYKRAWEPSHERLRTLAAEMARANADVNNATDEEVAEFNEIQSFIRKLDGKPFDRMHPTKLEERIYQRFGPSGLSDTYFLMAAEMSHTGHSHNAAILINRGIYVACTYIMPAIRTLAALIEAFGAAREGDLVEEHTARIRTSAKLLKRMAKTEDDLGRLNDMLSELTIATDKLAHTWQPTSVAELSERTLAEQSATGTGKEPDALTLLSNARQLLARGNMRHIPEILREVIERIKQGEHSAPTEAILASVYVMARACRDDALTSVCASQLNARNLHPEALYLPGDANPQASTVLEMLINSDTRCIASVALCLRLAGLDQRLFEFARISSTAGADAETLDAILSQVVHSHEVKQVDLHRVSDDIIGTTRLTIPSGLGWYYYPGIMLCAAWSGIVFTAVGLASILTMPKILIFGMALMAAELVGGSLDLVIWRLIHLWEKPEISRRLLVPELASIVSLWVPFLLLRSWLNPIDPKIGVGALIALTLSVGFELLALRGILFAPLSSIFICVGTGISILLAGVLGTVFTLFFRHVIHSSMLSGVCLGGILFIGFSLSILPKRFAVVRHYSSRIDAEESDIRLFE